MSRTSRSLLMPLLLPCAGLYGLAVRLRNARFDRNPAAARRTGIPVISVGNITVGGTGKTPMAIEITRRLVLAGRRPAVVTRGYRGTPQQEADEVLELRDALPGVPVVVNADRVAGAAQARDQYGADCLVLDDGFQHRRLRRDFDIVLIDALDPWGGDHLLPAGRLREPLDGLRRADVLIVTRSNQTSVQHVEHTCALLRKYAPHALVLRAAVAPDRLVFADAPAQPPGALRGARLLPVCGLGNPASFAKILITLGANAVPPLIFPDHHDYQPKDADAIARTAAAANVDLVVTTRKDWVKLASLVSALHPHLRLARLEIRVAIADPTEVFAGRLNQALEA